MLYKKSIVLFDFFAFAHAAFLFLIEVEMVPLNQGLSLPLILNRLTGVCLSHMDKTVDLK